MKIALDTDKIKALRLKLDLTQQQCADRAGFPNAQKWFQYESGRLKNPTLLNIERIAKALGVHASELIK